MSANEMWLQEQETDNGWIASQIRSYNARLGDFIIGGEQAPRLSDMDQWRANILAVRSIDAKVHLGHTPDRSDFGCKACHIAGWVVCKASLVGA